MPLRQIAAGTGVNNDQTPLIDIVAVHGLNPFNSENHEYNTWRKPTNDDGCLWLRDEFPKPQPCARVFLYKYNSSPAFGAGRDSFVREGNRLLEDILLKRGKMVNPKRPLILIGHSLGGILIKQALVNAHANEKYTPIKAATYGLVFFGTPHAGPAKNVRISLGKTCVRVARAVSWCPPNNNMDTLEHGSLFDDLLQESFVQQLENYQIVSFYEGIGNVVPYDSAVFHLAGLRETKLRIDADHSNMCRFDLSIEADRDNYELVEGNLDRLCQEATKDIERNSEERGFAGAGAQRESFAFTDPRNVYIDQSSSTGPTTINIHDFPGFAWHVYKSCEDSSAGLKTVAGKVSELYLYLKKTKELLEEDDNAINTCPSADSMLRDCYRVLQEIQNMSDEYKSYGARSRRTWDQMGYDVEHAGLLERKLASNLQSLKKFNGDVTENSTVRLEAMLNGFLSELRSGKRAPSIISGTTSESLSANDEDFWWELRRELEDAGISKAVLDRRRAFIVDRILEGVRSDCPQTGTQQDSDNASPDASPAASVIEYSGATVEPISSDEPTVPKITGGRAGNAQISEQRAKPSESRSSRTTIFLHGLFRRAKHKMRTAIEEGDSLKVQALLNSGCSINFKDRTGLSVLHLAVERGDTDIATMLCKRGADVGATDISSVTPLHLASAKGNEDIAELLLKNGANIEAVDNAELTPLHSALNGLDSLFQLDLFGSPLFMYFGTCFDLSATPGSRVGRSIANSGVNPPEWTMRRYERVVELLLANGANSRAASSERMTPLHIASKTGRAAVVRMVRDCGAEIDPRDRLGTTPLHIASFYGYEEVTKLLLNFGADVEARNNRGMTPLIMASMEGHEAIVALLLQHGSDYMYKLGGFPGHTPLHIVSLLGHTAVARMLIERGARVDSLDSRRGTPLHKACGAGKEVIVRLLLENAANIEAKDDVRWTPLHRAIRGGHADVVRFLLREGADLHSEAYDVRWKRCVVDRMCWDEPGKDQRTNESITPLKLLLRSERPSLKEIVTELQIGLTT